MTSDSEELLHPVPLDCDLSDERFDQLVGSRPGVPAASVETDPVDFKIRVELTDSGLAELAKDVAAFANSGGGYLLIGVSQTQGQLEVIGIEDAEAQTLGEPTLLHQKLSRWLSPVPAVLCRRIARPTQHRHSVMVFVHPFDSIPILFLRDSQDAQAHALYVRRSVASQPATKDDWQRILERVVERQRAHWTRQVDSVVNIAHELSREGAIGTTESAVFDEVPDTPLNRLRARVDDFSKKVMAMIGQASAASAQEDTAGLRTEITAVLDNLVDTGIHQIRFRHSEGLDLVLKSLEDVLNARPLSRNGPDRELSLFLGELALPRLFALGAASTRFDGLWAAAPVVRKSIDNYAERYGIYWHRYLMTMLYRAQRMPHNALKLAFDYLEGAGTTHDAELHWQALAQFDYLRCAICEMDYPGESPLANFVVMDRWMIEPLVRSIISQPQLRAQALGSEVTDERLASLLWRMETLARTDASSMARYGAPYLYVGWQDQVIHSFLARHPRQDEGAS